MMKYSPAEEWGYQKKEREMLEYGQRINTLEEISQAAHEKRSLCYLDMSLCGHPCRPAGVILNMAGSSILQMLNRGLYIYTPKRTRKEPFWVKGR